MSKTHARGMRAPARRGWRSAAAGTAAVMALTGVAVAGGTPSPAAAATCDEAYPVADLTEHQAVTGLTVSEGTTPDGFTGEVLGVVQNGISPGVDMIMVRLTSSEIDRVGGIWAGMSGSPVYADDGRLIGAVAYGLAWGPSPVAGVTPYEDMGNYIDAAARVPVGRTAAQRVASAAGISAAKAAQGFEQLPLSGGVTGLSSRDLAKLTSRPKHQYAGMSAEAATVGTTASATAADIVPGGNLGFAASYGDISIAALGTVTSVCGDRVVGFGHPATYAGKIVAGLQPADAIYVQEDPVSAPFKVGNLAAPVGTITDDHKTGITGTVGPLPDTLTVTSTASYGTRSRTGSSDVYMPDYAATTTLYQLYYNADSVIDAAIKGSELATWTIAGTGPDGKPFSLDLGDRYRSTYDIADAGVWDVPDLVWMLSRIDGVTIDSVTANGAYSDNTDRWRVATVAYRSHGTWVKVNRHKPIRAVAGEELRLRVGLKAADGSTKNTTMSFDLAEKLAGNRGYLQVLGGDRVRSGLYSADSFEDLMDLADGWVRNDQTAGFLYVDTGRRGREIKATSPAEDLVVTGGKRYIRVVVR
ncbi:MAG: SpoIVB peptidase S55 domain-containing protein [Nocardioides sp.]|uniref:hypothetical protein n=1 Tax=Nocardioides sp. TaxID=35761 RepID=UPI0039E60E31